MSWVQGEKGFSIYFHINFLRTLFRLNEIKCQPKEGIKTES